MMSIEMELEQRLICAGDTTVSCVTPLHDMNGVISGTQYRIMVDETPSYPASCFPSPIGSDGKPQFWCVTEKMWFAQGPVSVKRSREDMMVTQKRPRKA